MVSCIHKPAANTLYLTLRYSYLQATIGPKKPLPNRNRPLELVSDITFL